MFTYTIKKNDFAIGQCVGRHKAFEFIQKEIDRCGLLGYWKEDEYIFDYGKFKIERTDNV